MADITVTLGLIGTEDLSLGAGTKTTNATASRTTSTGGSTTIHKITAAAIPVEDVSSYWTATNVEDVLDGLHAGSESIVANAVAVKSRNAANTDNYELIKLNSSNHVVISRLISPTSMCIPPVGSIVAWNPGYYTDGSNGTYTNVLGTANTIASANTYLNPLGWYVCNGTALNDADSPIWVGGGRYLPNLSDDRFLDGATTAGGTGGINTLTPTVITDSHVLTTAEMPAHTHTVNNNVANTGTGGLGSGGIGYDVRNTITTSAGGDGGHTHVITNDSNLANNRPLYLNTLFIIRVK